MLQDGIRNFMKIEVIWILNNLCWFYQTVLWLYCYMLQHISLFWHNVVEASPEYSPKVPSNRKSNSDGKHFLHKSGGKEAERRSRPADKGLGSGNRDYSKGERPMKYGVEQNHVELTSSSPKETTANDMQNSASRSNGFPGTQSPTCGVRVDTEPACSSAGTADRDGTPLQSKVVPILHICLIFF